VAILGLGLTAIFAAQAGAFKSVHHSRAVSEATGMVRCRMSELEQELGRDGFPALDVNEAGPCCDGELHPKISCVWRVEKPEFPEPNYGELDLGADLDLASPSGAGEDGPASAGLAGLGALPTGPNGLALPENGSVGDVASSILGDTGGGGLMDGVASMLMGIVYPDLKMAFEAGTRRVTVSAVWYEGEKEYTLDVQQWLTSARQAGLVGDLPEGEEAEEGDDEADPPKKNFAPEPPRRR
jgi:general secretion pathway protein I